MVKGVPKGGVRIMGGKETTDPSEPGTADQQRAWREHNDGHRPSSRGSNRSQSEVKEPKVFSAQSYLRYQGDKVGLPMT